MEGSFRNIKDNSETIIKKVGENQYEVIAAFDPRLHFTVTRKENILTGSFQSKSVVIEYNSTFDTITNKASGNIVFICKRINK